ncbi:MAG: sigma 54-interacting transcriptional regulator [Candidatus Fermentithermobacillus carboniphilus]|uniref:Sigma 54-interacting transcriptional regulator n=1 Tax=Candidatus Fermentithermobacillus carboniphilus TaxID=3085328 RepID=A0AAT9LD08_9FIRM|nr:MAG: sigma 54-interacting transcriptional regulator [Candidatus Fermentithermobacillus carboniphilus]
MVSLEEKLKDLISREDPICPLSDERLSRMLCVSRASITMLRERLGIPNSRARRKAAIARLVSEEVCHQGSSMREISRILARKGVKVSHSTVSGILKAETSTSAVRHAGPTARAVKRSASTKTQADIHRVFLTLVGAEGSLKPVIQLAQAAVMYPPHGLNTLILGPTGVGKTELAMAMHRYAVEIGTIPPDGPFVSMNCADYADNPQLLMSHLFGHTKGAFTGATDDKPGLVELANGGILFLDEIHRLPPQGQEMLFGIIDKGTFRRLGESDSERRTSFLLIAATSSDPDVALLDAMRRRLPVVIRIPSLSARPPAERLEMIKRFFSTESAKINAPVEVAPAVVEALLKYECPGNVGQLKADIQVACARGYLKFTTGKSNKVSVTLDDLPPYAAQGLMESRSGLLSFSAYLGKNIVFEPGQEICPTGFLQDDYAFPDNLYEWMETRYDQLAASGLSPGERTRLMANELDRMIAMQLRSVHARGETLQALEISKVSDPCILQSVDAAITSEFPEMSGDRTLIACIAIHLTASLERMRQGRNAVNPRELLSATFIPVGIREKSKAVLKEIQTRIGAEFPEYEADFIAMYVSSRRDRSGYPAQKVGIVLMSHGRVASAIKDVVDTLLPGIQIHTVELDLHENLKNAFGRAKDVVKQADKGMGVLVVADMGSLVSFGGIISENTGIKIHTLGPLTTVLVLDVARRAMAGTSLEELVCQVENDMTSSDRGGIFWSYSGLAVPANGREKIVLVVCITGLGLAAIIANYLSEKFKDLKNVEFVPVSSAAAVVEARRLRPNVIASVGSIDPKIPGVPYIEITDLGASNGIRELENILNAELSDQRQPRTDMRLADTLNEDCVLLNVALSDPREIIKELSGLLAEKGFVTPSYVETVLDREDFFPTSFGSGVALPHGSPDQVVRPAIAAARLSSFCDWGGNKVRLVFLLALRTDCVAIVEQLQAALEFPGVLEYLNTAPTPREFRDALLMKGLAERR